MLNLSIFIFTSLVKSYSITSDSFSTAEFSSFTASTNYLSVKHRELRVRSSRILHSADFQSVFSHIIKKNLVSKDEFPSENDNFQELIVFLKTTDKTPSHNTCYYLICWNMLLNKRKKKSSRLSEKFSGTSIHRNYTCYMLFR